VVPPAAPLKEASGRSFTGPSYKGEGEGDTQTNFYKGFVNVGMGGLRSGIVSLKGCRACNSGKGDKAKKEWKSNPDCRNDKFKECYSKLCKYLIAS